MKQGMALYALGLGSYHNATRITIFQMHMWTYVQVRVRIKLYHIQLKSSKVLKRLLVCANH